MRASALAFVVKVGAAGVIFGYNVLVARLLGVDDAGLFFLGHSLLTIAVVVGRVGLDNPLVRFVAGSADGQRWHEVRGVARQGLALCAAVAAVVSLLCFVLAPWTAQAVFGKPDLAPVLRVLALGIVPLSLTLLVGQLLRGLSKITAHLVVVSALVPAIACVTAVLLAPTHGLVGVAGGWTVATVLALIVAAFLWQRHLAALPPSDRAFPFSRLLASAHPLFWMSLASVVVRWSSPLMLGIWSTGADVALFTAAVRTAFLTSLILVAVTSIVAPRFAAAHGRGDDDELERIARTSSGIMALAAAPVCLLLVLAPEWVLAIFGEGFAAAAPALALLAAAQFVNVATGSIQYLLAMCGEEIALRNLNLAAAFAIIMLNVALIPAYGLWGAALAMTVVIVGQNVAATWIVHKSIGIWPLPAPWRSSKG